MKSQKVLGNYLDHPRKQLFRSNWGKPLLEWLNGHLKFKLIYMGLPGFQALDIIEWIDHIEKVIAFEAKEDEGPNSTESIIKVLSKFEEQKKLQTYSLYEGFLEKTVMTGVDNAGQVFNQSDFITIYNLDFCNSLTSPCRVPNLKGDLITFYKLDAIDKLMELQSNTVENSSAKFIMFLTVNSVFWDDEFRKVNNVKYLKIYDKRIEKLNQKSRNVRQLKAYVFYYLNEFGKKHGLNIELLPPIYYKGRGGVKNEKGIFTEHWLTTFTIIGTKIEGNKVELDVYKQDESSYLGNKFIFANDVNLTCYTEKLIEENDVSTNAVELLLQSQTYQKLWKVN